MHVPRAYMPVMLAKGPAPFTARSVALRWANSLTVRPTVTTRNKLDLLRARYWTVTTDSVGSQKGTGAVPLHQRRRTSTPRAGMRWFQIMLLFISMGLRAVVHAFGSLPSGHHLDVNERVKSASAVDPLWSWKKRNTGTKR